MEYRIVFYTGPRPDKLVRGQNLVNTETQAISTACALIAKGGYLDVHIEDGNGRTVFTESEIKTRSKSNVF